jgi:chorismate--pyruvate lyase
VRTIPADVEWQRKPIGAGVYRPWLTDRGSLTARIARLYPAVRVRVLFQGLRRPDRDERFLFGEHAGARVLVREVFLTCGDTPVVFAHTVADPRDLRGAWRGILKLGNRPLGAALFADARVERYPLLQKKLGPHHELHARLKTFLARPPSRLWARRSLFRLHDSPILVTEVFLPGILHL